MTKIDVDSCTKYNCLALATPVDFLLTKLAKQRTAKFTPRLSKLILMAKSYSNFKICCLDWILNDSLQYYACSRAHEIEDLQSLASTIRPPPAEDAQDDQLFLSSCDICVGSRNASVCYCCDCKKNFCEEHYKVS